MTCRYIQFKDISRLNNLDYKYICIVYLQSLCTGMQKKIFQQEHSEAFVYTHTHDKRTHLYIRIVRVCRKVFILYGAFLHRVMPK